MIDISAPYKPKGFPKGVSVKGDNCYSCAYLSLVRFGYCSLFLSELDNDRDKPLFIRCRQCKETEKEIIGDSRYNWRIYNE